MPLHPEIVDKAQEWMRWDPNPNVKMSEIVDKAQEWMRWDPNPSCQKHVDELLTQAQQDDKEALKELQSLFPLDNSRVGFGTAGLRSKMKVGPLGMNDLVIIQTCQGLLRYCQAQAANNNKQLRVVIGYDHRCNPKLGLSSRSFAILSALVFQQAANMECILLDGYVHTPLVAFSTTRLDACMGIMITASHNPKEDAGYKVYWKDGIQIRPPIDAEIAASILDNLKPWTDYAALLSQRRVKFGSSSDPCLGLANTQVTAKMTQAYLDAIRDSGLVTGQAAKQKLGAFDNVNCRPPPRFCYTAMHGVGYKIVQQVLGVFGFHTPIQSVLSQQEPDPTFATVPFPNPEEVGALEMAKAFAIEHDCDIVFANDPDADRLAVAEKDGATGEWTVFTGDQIGTLLGHWLWEQLGKSSDKPVAMCASTVSSTMLQTIAEVEGFYFKDTLTGFKWIGSKAQELSRQGYRCLLCYEEAIGFCCGSIVFDKDGVSALGVFAELAYSVYRENKTVAQHMQGLYDKYGEFVSNNGYYFYKDPAVVSTILEGIRNNGKYDLEAVGPYKITSIRDLGVAGFDSTTSDKRPTLPTSKSSPMITLRFENASVAQFRGSGTEPKLKYYIEMRGQPGVARDEVTRDLAEFSNVILQQLLKPDENGLFKTKP